jgi:hypothetical protein
LPKSGQGQQPKKKAEQLINIKNKPKKKAEQLINIKNTF